MNVHITRTPGPELLTIFQKALDPQIKPTFGEEIPDPAKYQILVTGFPTAKLLTFSPNLKHLIIPWAGLPSSTREMMLDYPEISVHNLHHNATPTAETALALLFAAAKFIIPFDKALRVHDWRPRYQPNPSMLLRGKTALILGYGAIGQYIAKVLNAMGLRIIAVRKNYQEKRDHIAEVSNLNALPDLLPQADVLMIALPGTPETEGLIGKSELSLLPKGLSWLTSVVDRL